MKTLYSFGSVLNDQFSENSDVDLLVDFIIEDPIEYAENYFQLKFNLEDVLKRKIDLLESKSLQNPFLKKSIDQTKKLVYG